MTLQPLLAFSPFLALLFVLYTFIQALRRQRRGFGAALLACIAVAVPLAALVLTTDAAVKARLADALALNAAIVFVASLLILLIERRNPAHASSRSYGGLAIGVSVVLAAEIFVVPLLLTLAPGGDTTRAADASTSAPTDGTLQTVMDVASTEETPVAQALTAQTGLTLDEITTQITAGSTIAQLVAANSGDLAAVTAEIIKALDELKTAGGMPAQMLSNLGSDSAAIAAKLVQGELEARAQQFLLRQLTSSGGGFPPMGQNPAGGAAAVGADAGSTGGLPPAGGFPSDMGTPGAFPSGDTSGSGGGFPSDMGTPARPVDQAVTEPTVTPSPTTITIRPTLITFPTATATPEVVETSATPTIASITCTLVVNYNLNLREQPNTDSTVFLSIPFGTSVVADGRTAAGWYSVRYEGKSGWVSGDFVTPDSTCSELPVAN